MDYATTPIDPSLPPKSWEQIVWYLDGILIHWINADEQFETPGYDRVLHSREDILQMMGDYEKEWLSEVESIIALICISGEVDLRGFSPQAIQLATLRTEVIANHIATLHVSEKSIFGLPTQTFGECIQWLMTDWWDEHGRELVVIQILSGYRS